MRRGNLYSGFHLWRAGLGWPPNGIRLHQVAKARHEFELGQTPPFGLVRQNCFWKQKLGNSSVPQRRPAPPRCPGSLLGGSLQPGRPGRSSGYAVVPGAVLTASSPLRESEGAGLRGDGWQGRPQIQRHGRQGPPASKPLPPSQADSRGTATYPRFMVPTKGLHHLPATLLSLSCNWVGLLWLILVLENHSGYLLRGLRGEVRREKGDGLTRGQRRIRNSPL